MGTEVRIIRRWKYDTRVRDHLLHMREHYLKLERTASDADIAMLFQMNAEFYEALLRDYSVDQSALRTERPNRERVSFGAAQCQSFANVKG